MEQKIFISISQKSNGKFTARILNQINRILLISKDFSSLQELNHGLQNNIKLLGERGNYELKKSEDSNRFHYSVLTPNKEHFFLSELFTTRSAAENSIDFMVHNYDKINLNSLSDYIYNKTNKNNISKIGSISTLVHELTRLSNQDEYTYFFRGHANHEFKMIPGIYRKQSWIKNEFNFFKEIRLKCPGEFHQGTTAFQSLVKMQHYSLPTRLLDLTSNALIALYFATESIPDKENDGQIIVLKVPKREIKYYDDAKVSLLSNISRVECNVTNDTNTINAINLEQLKHFAKSDGAYLNNITSEMLNDVICVKPQMDNPRIIRQDGTFLLFGINGVKDNLSKLSDKFKCDEIPDGLIIKKEEKQKLRFQLANLGITEGTIYPEIDHVANYIKNNMY